MGKHQNKESPVRTIEHHATISPEKHDWLNKEELSSLLGG